MPIPKLIRYDPFLKRALDILLSSVALILLSPLFYLISIFIKSNSKGPVFFRQKRIGQDFRPFKLTKFRSMTVAENPRVWEFEPGGKSRVTRVGAFLRKFKFDELPELFNVLNGDMSIVGPRPEVEKYVLAYPEDFVNKFKKAKRIKGIRLLYLLSPCPPDWKISENLTVHIARLAVQARIFPLFEVVNGKKYTINVTPGALPVKEFLRPLGGLRHLTSKQMAVIQKRVEGEWEQLLKKT